MINTRLKNSILVIIMTTWGLIYTKNTPVLKIRSDYEFYFTPMWISLDEPYHMSLFDQTAWILVGSFTIRAKEPVTLDLLELKWCGSKDLEIEAASLYKSSGKIFKATEDYLVCDGQWYKDQTINKLVFNFIPYPLKVSVSTILYLVLTINSTAQNILSNGKFEIIPDHLPGCLQKALKASPLYLTFSPHISTPSVHLS